jgi:hypothetical protein
MTCIIICCSRRFFLTLSLTYFFFLINLGYNFDQITCESCKAFFRRNALNNAVSFHFHIIQIIVFLLTRTNLNVGQPPMSVLLL